MPETPAVYQRRRRDRLRGQGLVKREIWVPPSYADLVRRIEQALQAGVPPIVPPLRPSRARDGQLRYSRSASGMSDRPWTFETLFQSFNASEQAKDGQFAVERIEGAEPVMVVTMQDFGDLPVTVSVAGSQIVMSVLLWPVDAVDDAGVFERELLMTHKMIPLSTYGITRTGDGELWYEIFGALSSGSSFETVLIELETLADNAIDASEHFEDRVSRPAA